jgi:hypothetical protein
VLDLEGEALALSTQVQDVKWLTLAENTVSCQHQLQTSTSTASSLTGSLGILNEAV